MASEAKKLKSEPAAPSAESTDALLQQVNVAQNQIEALNDEASEAILEIEKRFNLRKRPVFEQRNAVIRQIPNFWPQVFLSHEQLSAFINEADQKVLESLVELDVQDFADIKSGFKIVFKFNKNQYFKNDELWKEFKYTPDGELKVTCSAIDWFPGKNITDEGGADDDAEGRKRNREEADSFFLWFDPADQEIELGELIKEDIWPNPLKVLANIDEPDNDDAEDDDSDEDDEDAEDDEVAGN